MQDWFEKKTYNFVGRIMGYGVAPLSIASLGLPVYLRLPEGARRFIGSGMLFLAVIAILCNLYLVCRRKVKGYGASMFPLIVSATGISALFLTHSDHGHWLAPFVVLILVFDFFGQALLGEWICARFLDD